MISFIILLNPSNHYINIILQEMRVAANYINLKEIYSKNETQIYEDLSLFIQIFKRLILNIQLTAINVQKENQYVSSLEKIRHTLKQLQPIAQKYGNQMESSLIEPVTFRRLTCRLMEVITQYQIKYQSTAKSSIFFYFFIGLREVEEAIRINEEGRLLGNIIKIMQISAIKFCMNCEKSRCFVQNKEKLQYSEAYQTMNEKIKRFKRINSLTKDKQSRQIRCSHEIHEETVINNQPANLILRSPQQKTSKNNEVLMNIQNQYDLYQGMDLDLRLFKTSYIYAKNNPNQVEKDCLQRNQVNGKLITTYHDDFQLFKKRKSKKQNRKNQKRSFKSDRKKNQTLKQRQYEKKQYARIRIKKINQGLDQTIPQEKVMSLYKQLFRNKYMPTVEESKISYKLNNIYLTLNKTKHTNKQLAKDGEISPISRNKKGEPQKKLVNQTYYNQITYNSTHSINFLHSKLKIQSTQKDAAVLRIKTQNDEDSKKDIKNPNEKSCQKVVIDVIHYPFKQSKYLEIVSMKNKRQAYSKSVKLKGITPNLQISTVTSNKKNNQQNPL